MNWYDGINVVLWNRMGVHNYKASLICGSLLGSTGKILTIPTWDEVGVIYFWRPLVYGASVIIPLGIKRGWLENPRTKWRFIAGKIIYK